MPDWQPCCGSWPNITPKIPIISSWSDWLRCVAKQKEPCTRLKLTFGKVCECVCVCVYVHALRVCVRVIIDFLLCLPLQGLTHLGKGTLTLCPYHSDRQLMSQVAVAGLLTVLVSFLDVKNSELIFSHSAAHIHY